MVISPKHLKVIMIMKGKPAGGAREVVEKTIGQRVEFCTGDVDLRTLENIFSVRNTSHRILRFVANLFILKFETKLLNIMRTNIMMTHLPFGNLWWFGGE